MNRLVPAYPPILLIRVPSIRGYLQPSLFLSSKNTDDQDEQIGAPLIRVPSIRGYLQPSLFLSSKNTDEQDEQIGSPLIRVPSIHGYLQPSLFLSSKNTDDQDEQDEQIGPRLSANPAYPCSFHPWLPLPHLTGDATHLHGGYRG